MPELLEEEKPELEEEAEPEFNEAQKAWLEKQEAKRTAQANETAEQLAKRLKDELKVEQEKTSKAAARKLASDKAKAENDTAEVLRLANEEKAEAQRERDEARAEAQKVRDTNAKLALVQKYKLPAGYELRILGADATAWELDAAELAKSLPAPKRPDMDGGDKNTKTKEAQTTSAVKKATSLVSGF